MTWLSRVADWFEREVAQADVTMRNNAPRWKDPWFLRRSIPLLAFVVVAALAVPLLAITGHYLAAGGSLIAAVVASTAGASWLNKRAAARDTSQ